MDTKKTIAWLLIFSFVTSSVLAGGFIKKGQTFIAKEDVRYFTYEESVRMLKEIENGKKLAEKVSSMEKIVANYEAQIAKHEAAAQLDKAAMANYKDSIGVLKESVQEARKATIMYKEIILVQNKSLKTASARANSNRRMRRWERNLSFVLGFIAPVAGAYAAGRVADLIK